MNNKAIEINPNTPYTIIDLSHILRLSHQTANRLVREKQIKARKTGNKYLILGSEILNYLKSSDENE